MAKATNITEAKRAIIRGLNSSWFKATIDLIEESYGLRFDDANTAVHDMNINFTTYGAVASMGYSYYDGHASGTLTLNINIQYFQNIDVDDENGLDTTIAHEFTHAAMEVNIDYFNELPGYIVEGTADLVPGADGRYLNMYDLLIDGKSNLQNSFNNNGNYNDNYAAGFMALRYMAKQGSNFSGKSQHQVIKDFMHYLDVNGARNLDLAINYATGGLFTGEKQMTDAFMSALNQYGVTNEDQANAFLKEFANIEISDRSGGVWIYEKDGDSKFLNFTDCGAITGADAGGTLKNDQSIVPTLTDNWTLPRSSSLTYKGLTIHWPEEFIDVNGTYDLKINTVSGNVAVGTADDDIIYNYLSSNVEINANAGNDEINSWGNSENVTVNGGKGDDTLYGEINVFKYSDGDGDDIIYDYTTDKIIQLLSGNISNSEIEGTDVILKIGSGSIRLKYANGKKITVQDPNGNVTSKIYDNSNRAIEGTPNNDTLRGSDGSNITINGNAGNDLIINGEWYGTKGTTEAVITGGAGNDTINNSGSNSVLDGGNGDDLIYNGYYYYEPWEENGFLEESYNKEYNDENGSSKVTISGGAGNDEIHNNGSEITYKYNSGDGDDTIYGYNNNDTIKIFGSGYTESVSGNNVILKIGEGSITLIDAKNKTLNIETTSSGGSDTTPADTLPVGISVKSSVVTASNLFSGSEINLADYENATKVNAAALSQAVSIVGTAANNSLKGGKGADTIFGGAGNDTVSLGGGKDVYIYSSGNDLIQDYKAGDDKIKLTSGSITSASLSSSNVILSISNGGKITVKGGKNKNITVIDSNGNETTNIYPLSTLPAGISVKSSVVTASTLFSGSEINLADYENATKVNAAALSQAVSIVGTAANNSLKGGKGADYITGGLGNDTLTGGAGADTYVYSGGDDLITDYANVDAVQFDTENITDISREISGKNVIYSTNVGTLTLKNASTKNITLIDSNGDDFTLNKNIAENLWFMEDNFNNYDLDSICEQKFEVQNIEDTNYNIEQEKILLTFTDEK